MPVNRRPGMCVDCGTKPPGEKSKSRCDKCHGLQAERGKRFREKHRERLLEAERERRRTDAEYLRRRADDVARYRERYPERAKQVVEARRARPEAREHDRQRRSEYYAEKRQDREWVAENTQYRRPFMVRRRALKAGADGHFTAKQWRDLCDKHGNRCAYCGKSEKLTVDHVIPLSRGGSNYIDNILPACQPCNSRKHAKTVDEFCPPVLF